MGITAFIDPNVMYKVGDTFSNRGSAFVW
jgi:hypothetical protein